MSVCKVYVKSLGKSWQIQEDIVNEDLTIKKIYVIILKKDIFKNRKAPVQENIS